MTPMGCKEAGLSGFLGGLGSHEMLELVIWGAIRDACASPFRRRATCCWATGPMARQATIGGQFLGHDLRGGDA